MTQENSATMTPTDDGAMTKVNSFQNSSVFNTQKSLNISLRQIFISKLTKLMFPSADFYAKLTILF